MGTFLGLQIKARDSTVLLFSQQGFERAGSRKIKVRSADSLPIMSFITGPLLTLLLPRDQRREIAEYFEKLHQLGEKNSNFFRRVFWREGERQTLPR